MNIVFWLIVIVALVLLWFCLSFAFKGIGAFGLRIYNDAKKEAMKEFRDFLAENHITNVATDSYTLDWSRKSISITAYAQTKAQSRLIDEYIERSLLKCKRVIRKN